MLQGWRETHSHWNLPHCTKHLSLHSTLHSLSLYQLAASAYSTNIHLCLPLWKILVEWVCPSVCPHVTQLYLHKVSFSCIIRRRNGFVLHLLSGSRFVPSLRRAGAKHKSPSAFVEKNHTKVVWKTCEMESEAEVGSGTRKQSGVRSCDDSYTCFNNYPLPL